METFKTRYLESRNFELCTTADLLNSFQIAFFIKLLMNNFKFSET